MLNCWFGGGGVGKVGGEEGDGSGGVGGDDNCRMCCPIKLTALLGETQARSSSLSRGGEIKGLFPNPSIPLKIHPLHIVPLINVCASPSFHITTY